MNTQPFVEWFKHPRGTYTTHINGLLLEVFKLSGYGWRFNASNAISGEYEGYETEFGTLDEACESAIKFAEDGGL